MKLQATSYQLQVFRRTPAGAEAFNLQLSTFHALLAFSLIEVLLTVTLLSLIILALMNVFSSTQQAFRASVTQTDVLEGGRAVMQMIADDLRELTHSDKPPVGSPTNVSSSGIFAPVNFSTTANSYNYSPLIQSLPASAGQRINLLNYFFILKYDSEHNKWIGIGYIVDTASATALYPLYRFYAEADKNANPLALFSGFNNAVLTAQWTNMSHLMDGVVHLVVRAHDPNGGWINNFSTNVANTFYASPVTTPAGPFSWGEGQFYMFSNTIPAAVELQLGIIEDRTLQRAESLPTYNSRTNYLEKQSGHVHIFRQLVIIPNVDPSAYQ